MSSTKLKIIFAVAFLLINLFFAYRLSKLTEDKNFFTEAEITEAVAVLKAKGLQIDPDTVLRERTVPHTVNLSFDGKTLEKIAGEIMHGEYAGFNIPDGQNFTGSEESFSVYYDYTFEYKNSSIPTDTEGVKSILSSAPPSDEKTISETEKTFERLIKRVTDTRLDIDVKIENAVTHDGLTYIKGVECINSHEISDAVFYIVTEGNKVWFASGKFYFTDSFTLYSTDAFDSINILFELESTEKPIEKMEIVYFPVFENASSVYLTPSYSFTLADGEGFVIDATSGVKR